MKTAFLMAVMMMSISSSFANQAMYIITERMHIFATDCKDIKTENAFREEITKMVQSRGYAPMFATKLEEVPQSELAIDVGIETTNTWWLTPVRGSYFTVYRQEPRVTYPSTKAEEATTKFNGRKCKSSLKVLAEILKTSGTY